MTKQSIQPVIKILLADDDECGARNLKLLLKKFGYSVTCCADGAEAISRIENSDFDLAIIDLHMPKINGIELAKHIKQLNNDIHIIITSGISTNETKLMLSQLEDMEFYEIPKPIDMRVLLQKIDLIFNQENKA